MDRLTANCERERGVKGDPKVINFYLKNKYPVKTKPLWIHIKSGGEQLPSRLDWTGGRAAAARELRGQQSEEAA